MSLRGRSTAKSMGDMVTEDSKGATQERDGVVMSHMGKKQQLNRNFGFFSILALSGTLLASWESVCSTFAAGLTNGGPVSLVYGMILSICGTMALAVSLAEMASICPIAGAQYHWTYLFAPPKAARFISWMQGWITVFGWQATVTSVTYLTATQIQGLMIFNYPSYAENAQRWHGTLLMWALMLITFVINVFGITLLPLIELLGGICHIAFFVALLVPLVTLAPRSTSDFVWASSLNESGSFGGGYSNGTSWCVGLLTVVYCFVGFDGAIHMSEEVRKASTTIPKILVLTIVINGALAFAFLIGLLYSIGDVTAALNTNTGYPIIEIFYQATQSTKAATAMMAGIIIIAFCSTFGILASVSRLTWAFARDGGLPFSEFFSYVNPTYRIPIRSIALVTVVVVLLSLINIGSSVAFNAVLSLSSLALYISYLIPIACLIVKRLRKEEIIFGPFTLGRFGLLVNLFAFAFGTFICIFLPFPPYSHVNGSTMNYAGPVFALCLIIALADWFIRGRKHFQGPLREVSEDAVQDEHATGAFAI